MSMQPFKIDGRKGWYIRFRDYSRPGGPWRQVKGGDRRDDAIVKLAREVERSNKIRDGIVTQRELRDADRMAAPIAALLDDWRESMEGRRITPSKINTWCRYVELIANDQMPPLNRGDETGPKGRNAVQSLAELDPNAVDKYLKRLMDTPYNRGVSTRNEYLTAIKAFIAWVRGTSNGCPLSCISKMNAKKDRRRQKRGLTVGEFERLIECVPTQRGGGHSREWYQAFYLVAGRCGGRWTEISKLRAEHVHSGFIHFDADIAKMGEDGSVELLPEVEQALRKIMPASGLIFGTKPTRRTFQRHLALAGIAYKLDDRTVSLRMTLASQLIALDPPIIPAELKRVMRHASITTTYGYYNDIALTTGGGAMQRLRRTEKMREAS